MFFCKQWLEPYDQRDFEDLLVLVKLFLRQNSFPKLTHVHRPCEIKAALSKGRWAINTMAEILIEVTRKEDTKYRTFASSSVAITVDITSMQRSLRRSGCGSGVMDQNNSSKIIIPVPVTDNVQLQVSATSRMSKV
jgi:hypothetical protein